MDPWNVIPPNEKMPPSRAASQYPPDVVHTGPPPAAAPPGFPLAVVDDVVDDGFTVLDVVDDDVVDDDVVDDDVVVVAGVIVPLRVLLNGSVASVRLKIGDVA